MPILNSELYYMKTGKSYFYNIMPINNIRSVISKGLLCYDSVRNINHDSVASSSVQARRENVIIPGGLKLHQYVNLYFTYHNPMLYLRKDKAEDLCILKVSKEVLDIDGCVVSDRNAATNVVRFYAPSDGIEKIDFNKVFDKFWTHPDNLYEQQNHKAIKCAEVLVPQKIDYSYVVGSYVYSEDSRDQMIRLGFNKTIQIEPEHFFR